jgi:hypothetical protein
MVLLLASLLTALRASSNTFAAEQVRSHTRPEGA